MRMRLASGRFVETVVTLGAAALMTFAGLAMLEEIIIADAGAPPAAVVAAPAALQPSG